MLIDSYLFQDELTFDNVQISSVTLQVGEYRDKLKTEKLVHMKT